MRLYYQTKKESSEDSLEIELEEKDRIERKIKQVDDKWFLS